MLCITILIVVRENTYPIGPREHCNRAKDAVVFTDFGRFPGERRIIIYDAVVSRFTTKLSPRIGNELSTAANFAILILSRLTYLNRAIL